MTQESKKWNSAYLKDEETQTKLQYTMFVCGFTEPSSKYVMNSNAMWNQEALNLVHFDGSIFKKIHMSLRQPFLASLYDIMIDRLQKQNLQLPFRFFHIKIDRIRQLGLEKCTENLRQIITQNIHKKYPGPIMFSSSSTGCIFALNVLRKLDFQVKNFFVLVPSLHHSLKVTHWQENVQNKKEIQQKNEDNFPDIASKFIREEIIQKQYPSIQDKVTTEDYRISPLFSTEEQFACFKGVYFHLYYAEKDGMLVQQLAFKKMLDSYKIDNHLEIFYNFGHEISFFRFLTGYSEQKIDKLVKSKIPFLEKLCDKLLQIGKSYHLVSQIATKQK